LFLTHTLSYNAALPTKFMPAPASTAYVAPHKYAQAAWVLGLGGHGEDAAREQLFARVGEVLATVGMPVTVADLGIDPDAYRAAIPDLVRDAFRDASMRTNPRMPLITELGDLFAAAA
jgi:acetaldehyde dehydrogenase/alcohol dehydrogenase